MIDLTDDNDSIIPYQCIQLPDFDVSWAGDSPWGTGYGFGSQDGRIRFTGRETLDGLGPFPITPSGDAINGVDWVGDLMAVSSRSEVVFLDLPQLGRGVVERTVYYGGAHGVTALRSGAIIAPMGRNGILWAGQKHGGVQSAKTLIDAEGPMNAYRTVSLGGKDRSDIVACAARQSGFFAMIISRDGVYESGKGIRPPGIDFIDVCSLTCDSYPNAAVALGSDCSLHFERDVTGGRGPSTLRMATVRGVGYRVMCADGHIFLLTSERLYTFPGLAARFLSGEDLNGMIKCEGTDVDAVDASLTRDRRLFIILPEAMQMYDLATLIAANERQDSGTDRTTFASLCNEPWEVFDDSGWTQSREMELVPA